MFTLPRHRRGGHDQGMTLVEVLVAIFLLAIVGAIVTGVVISAMKLTRTTGAGVESQSELNDAVSRITRDIAAADPILWTSGSNGWKHADNSPMNTPAADELWTQAVTNGKCVRTHYWVDATGTTKALKATTQTYAGVACPDPRLPDTTTAGATKTIVADLKTTDDTGVETPLFTYYDGANRELAAPVGRTDVPKIARVKIDVGSNVHERAKGVRLTTSVAPRGMDNPLVTSGTTGAPPSCANANVQVTSDGADPASPKISWGTTPNADTFTVNRTVPSDSTLDGTLGPFTANPGGVIDTTLKGRAGLTVNYTVDIVGLDGSSVRCDATPTAYITPTPSALPNPTLTVQVTPDTSTTPATIGSPQVCLTWNKPDTRITGFNVWRHAVDPNTAGHPITGPDTLVGSTTSLSWCQNPGFDQGFEYWVKAESTNYTPALTSGASNAAKAITHTSGVTLTGVVQGYGQNRLTWTADPGSTVDGYTLFRRPNGGGAWTTLASFGTGTLAYTDNVALDTRYDYLVTSYNNGPRGTQYPTEKTYYGNASNIATVLQYPASPTTTATGTEANPDGTNKASWNAGATATSYELWEFDSTGTTTAATKITGLTGTTYTDTGNSLGTRNYYMAIACNATGCSPNKNTPTGYAVAYQRPAPTPATLATAPTLLLNDVKISYTANADAGEATDKFCGTDATAQCRYDVYRMNWSGRVLVGSSTGTASTYSYNGDENKPGDWGASYNWIVQACNKGGCAADGTAAVSNHYPSDFTYVTGNITPEQVNKRWWEVGQTASISQNGTATYNWTASAGVQSTNAYHFQRVRLGNDPVNLTNDNYYGSGTTQTAALGATPGASYTFTVTATAANGLSRSNSFTQQNPPAEPGFVETDRYCDNTLNSKSGGNQAWKIAYRYRKGGYTNSGGSTYKPYADGYKVSEYVARTSNAADFSIWMTRVDNHENQASAPGSSWATSWTTTTDYWSNTTEGNTDAMTGNRILVTGAATNDSFQIPGNQTNTGGAVRIHSYVNQSGSHIANYGVWNGGGFTQTEQQTSGNTPCTGQTSGYTYWPGYISRQAHPGSPAYTDPNPNGWGASG